MTNRLLLPTVASNQPEGKSPTIIIGNCIDVLRIQRDKGIQYDAIVSDFPYEIGIHGTASDRTGVAFSSKLWSLLFDVLKPGGFIAAFSSTRKYHRLAVASEDAGFTLFPPLIWEFPPGLPKPVNVSELFDRDSGLDRRVVGYRDGSGYTDANVQHGAQNRTRMEFAVRERHVSDEAKAWSGYYYGVNALAPAFEIVLLAQKPASHERMIDSIREHGSGALHIGALRRIHGSWPSTILKHRKARKSDHQAAHPSVKPVSLMEELCLLVCRTGGQILDPFAGTGTTGIAAIRLGFDVTLIEIDPALEPVIKRRLEMDRVNDLAAASSKRSPEPLPKGIRRKARVTPPEIVASNRVANQAKVTGYRNRLTERGMRTIQLWVVDTSSLEFTGEADRQARAVTAAAENDRSGIV